MADLEGLGPYSSDCLDMFEMLEVDEAAALALINAPDRKFTPLNGVILMGEEASAGIKKREMSHRVVPRVARELLFLDRLLERFPKHNGSAPLFTYAVKVGDEHNGILTEDFTRGGTRILTETYDRFGSVIGDRNRVPEGLYRDIYDALDGRVYAEAFGHMLGFAFDREVLVDFDDVVYPDDDELERYTALVNAMTLQLAETD